MSARVNIKAKLWNRRPLDELKNTGRCVLPGDVTLIDTKPGTLLDLVFDGETATAVFVEFSREVFRNGLRDMICKALPPTGPA